MELMKSIHKKAKPVLDIWITVTFRSYPEKERRMIWMRVTSCTVSLNIVNKIKKEKIICALTEGSNLARPEVE